MRHFFGEKEEEKSAAMRELSLLAGKGRQIATSRQRLEGSFLRPFTHSPGSDTLAHESSHTHTGRKGKGEKYTDPQTERDRQGASSR